MSDNIIEFDFGCFTAYFNKNNSKTVYIPNQTINLKDKFFRENNFFAEPIVSQKGLSIYICINLTSNCNMRCKYCFNENKTDAKISSDEANAFIKKVIADHPNATKYFVDLSGSGEPLLEMESIIKIAKYTQTVQNVIGKEILVQLICNGTMLNSEMAKILQENNVLFGISLDGIKEYHDSNRVFSNGLGTFDIIMKNYLSIKNNTYIGAGMTFSCNDFPPLFESYLFLSKYFNTFSCRLSRNEKITDSALEFIATEYNKVAEYILDNLENNNIDFLFKITNGDDYFGRYIIKTVCEAYVNKRCDAGIDRFSLGTDHQVYACSAGVNIKKMRIENSQKSVFIDKYIRCQECAIEHICGGECLINLFNNYDNINLCKLKNALFEISLMICGTMYIYYPDLYLKLVNHVDEVISRQFGDDKLIHLNQKTNHKYTFNELKKIKDTDINKFNKLFKDYIK